MALNKTRQPIDESMDEDFDAALGRQTQCCHGKGKSKMVICLIVLIIIICGAAWCGMKMYGDPIAKVSKADWQAIFLSNGQVYFGKVNAVGNKTLTLSDIYYLQVVTKPLQTTQTGAAATADQTQQELTLIKLGNEIHGPSDRMVINRDQILLSEQLKNDSRVVQAIAKYVTDQKTKK